MNFHRNHYVFPTTGFLRNALACLFVGAMPVCVCASSQKQSTPRFHHVENVNNLPEKKEVASSKSEETGVGEPVDSLLPRSVNQILESLPASYPYMNYALKASGPWVISGYRPLPARTVTLPQGDMKSVLGRRYTTFASAEDAYAVDSLGMVQSIVASGVAEELGEETPDFLDADYEEETVLMGDDEFIEIPPIARGEYLPAWLREAMINDRIQDDAMYRIMVNNPYTIEYAYCDLPEPPRLPEEDPTFLGVLRRMNIPEVDLSKAVIVEESLGRRNWLHAFNTGLQFSQAYFSRNWYQGGSNHLSLLFNFLWDVSLNQVFHPNLMLQSVVSYKLGLSTTPKGSLHKYQISADIFQWNFKAGVKAYDKWFYSFNSLFKTQMLVNYPSDSDVRSASFLSPGEFNMGLGMTYNHANEKNTFKLSLSISPLSYNLKTCIDDLIDRTQFKITPPARTVNEIGSNVELTYEWHLLSNIQWRSRLFVFSDYKSLLGDWENTFDFAINQFLSTQFFFHLRYDSSTPTTIGTGWGKWQFKEFLSFGLSYTFNTIP